MTGDGMTAGGVLRWFLSRLVVERSRRWVPDMPSREEAEAYMARNAEKWRRPLVPPLRPGDIR